MGPQHDARNGAALCHPLTVASPRWDFSAKVKSTAPSIALFLEPRTRSLDETMAAGSRDRIVHRPTRSGHDGRPSIVESTQRFGRVDVDPNADRLVSLGHL